MNQEPLTPAEIQSLLGAEPPQAPAAEIAPTRVQPAAVPALDPRAVTGLRRIHHGFCQRLAPELSTLLRAEVRLRLASIETERWSETVRRLPNPTCLAVLSAEPLRCDVALHISPVILFPLLDRMLGGSGRAPDPLPRRPLTDIEVRLARRLMQAIVAGLQSAWRVVTPLTLLGDRIESDAGRAVIAATDEVVVVIACEVTLDSVHGPLQLCIPLRALEPQIRPLIAAGTGEGLAAQTADADGPLVQLTAQLAETTMTMEELLDLQPGDIITTPQSADEPIVVKVEGLPKYQGRAGRNQGRLAVRIEDRISSDDPSSDPGDRGA